MIAVVVGARHRRDVGQQSRRAGLEVVEAARPGRHPGTHVGAHFQRDQVLTGVAVHVDEQLVIGSEQGRLRDVPALDGAGVEGARSGGDVDHHPGGMAADSHDVGRPVTGHVGDAERVSIEDRGEHRLVGHCRGAKGLHRRPRSQGRDGVGVVDRGRGPDPGEVHRVFRLLPVPAPAEPGVTPYLDVPGRHVGDQPPVGSIRVEVVVDVDGEPQGVAR